MNFENNPTLRELGSGNGHSFFNRTKALNQHDSIRIKFPEAAAASTTGVIRGLTRSYKITTSPAVATGMAQWCGFDACFETTPYCMAMASSGQSKVLIAERITGRWKVKPATETPGAGAYGVSHSNPVITGGGVVYVPLTAGGTHCGKFWCTNTGNTNITTIDPHNGFATATFSIGYGSVRGMQFDSHRNVVWALYNAGAPYQVLQIDMEGTVTDTDIYGGIGQWIAVHPDKIYIGAAGGGYKLFEMDPSDMSQVDLAPTVTAGYVHQLMYVSDLDILVCGEGDGNNDLFYYNCSDDTVIAQTTVSGGLAYGSMGWVPELKAIVLGASASGNNIIDIYSSANIAVDTAHMVFPRYFPETDEAIGHDNSTELLVYPFD